MSLVELTFTHNYNTCISSVNIHTCKGSDINIKSNLNIEEISFPLDTTKIIINDSEKRANYPNLDRVPILDFIPEGVKELIIVCSIVSEKFISNLPKSLDTLIFLNVKFNGKITLPSNIKFFFFDDLQTKMNKVILSKSLQSLGYRKVDEVEDFPSIFDKNMMTDYDLKEIFYLEDDSKAIYIYECNGKKSAFGGEENSESSYEEFEYNERLTRDLLDYICLGHC